MKRFFFFIIFSIIAGSAFGQEAADKPLLEKRGDYLIIRRDRGGVMHEYMQRYLEIKNSDLKLAVDGECSSSCTLFMGYLPPENVCITKNAEFGFHRANNPEGTIVMMMTYPLPVLMWIMAINGLTENIKFMPFEFAKTIWPKCPDVIIDPTQGTQVD